MPMGSIAGVNSSLTVKLSRVVVFGLLALVFLTFTFERGFHLGFLLLALFFAALAANGILAGLQIQNNGGGTSEATVSLLDKAALEIFQ